MKVNVEEFKNFIRKATLNYSIDNIWCSINENTIKSKMVKSSKDAVVNLNLKNEIFFDIPDEVDFYFNEPNASLIPYLNLIDEDEAEILIKDEKIVLKSENQKSNIFFCEEEVVNKFDGDMPKAGEKFTALSINNEFLTIFNKIKKIGNKFGKIYFNINNNTLEIETTDKTNKFSNGLNFTLQKVKYENLSIIFDYQNLVNLFSILDYDNFDYTLDFVYLKEKKLGMIICTNNDDNNFENYYLMSKIDL